MNEVIINLDSLLTMVKLSGDVQHLLNAALEGKPAQLYRRLAVHLDNIDACVDWRSIADDLEDIGDGGNDWSAEIKGGDLYLTRNS